ncbi:MAG: hypothetical protein ISR45_10665 [Rhodospirillales bacterium]|nr:hypothetical protein [Rhodospirillales bacterium]
MINPFKFLGLAFLFMAGIYTIATYVPGEDPFSNQPSHQLVSLDGLPLPVFAELKFRHVARQFRYDVGLFGNSRSLDIGTRHLSLGQCRFFNFSVGSESFRFTVANLERLKKIGKAPKLALISIDNFELQRYNNPISLFASIRWKKAIADIMAGLTRADIGFKDFIRMGWRHVWIEVKRFEMTFNPETFYTGIVNLFSDGNYFQWVSPTAVGYHLDGSRNSPEPVKKMAFKNLLKPTSHQIKSGYFKFDLERLARLQKYGIQVVIYESSLEPKSAAAFHKRPSSQASGSRRVFNSACAKLGLKCYVAPQGLDGDEGLWTDHSHPPAKLVGNYLNKLLSENQLACLR